MKVKDLEVGMEVAERVGSYYPNAKPKRYVVMDTGTYQYRRQGRTDNEREPVILSATLPSGERVEVTSASLRPRGGFRLEHVVVAEETFPGPSPDFPQWRMTVLTPAQIEGPYEEVRALRAARRQEEFARDTERKAEQALISSRTIKAVERLMDQGVLIKISGTHLSLTLAGAEALADRLEAN